MDPSAGKYITISPYNYAVNNPVKYIGPDGKDFILSITRDKEGNITNVNVSATVYITGEGANEQRANELNDFSSSFFKQQNKSNVSFNINYVYRKNANKKSLQQGENILTFKVDGENGKNHRSSVAGFLIGNRHFTGQTGDVYGKGSSNFTVLHESLHLIGLSDRYQDKENSFTKKWYSEPDEGFERDIMGYHGGKSFDANYGKYYFDAAKFYSDKYGKDRVPLRRMVDMDGHLKKTPYEEGGYHLNVPTDKN
ncbi:hypothetical protein [Olivibacter sp. CPCC 100613]|uniref:hypothetical protein n=1 Tax=Olivibacter sp. CPCC 100613 TaxID=3079931 RepID=UPI003FA5FD6C